jgi:GNAT superfamily N-acetyltransferase
MAKGDTIVAVVDGRIIGTVTLARTSTTGGSPFYDRPDVASFGQFAVEPAFQGRGIGSTLLAVVEKLAIARGVVELALDTSEQAEGLIEFYTSKGYRFVEHARWPEVNYRSMIFAKRLSQAAGAG